MSFSFNEDGSLAVKKPLRRDHLPMLKALLEMPFSPGKKLLISHVQGKENSKTARLKLNRYLSFGDLGGYEEKDLYKLIDFLMSSKFIAQKKQKGLYPVLVLTKKGEDEIAHPSAEVRIDELEAEKYTQTAIKNPFSETVISDEERKVFASLHDFFGHFNDEQKKAVIDSSKKILCVAGAGSGKTSVLTKRIEFLHTYKGVSQDKILAITFTRKARNEMLERLDKLLGAHSVRVETFNSFCEKLLQKHGEHFYEKNVRMINRSQYTTLVIKLLEKMSHTPASIVKNYFTIRQRSGKDDRQLFFSFLYDLQALNQKIKVNALTWDEISSKVSDKDEHAALAHLLIKLVKNVNHIMKLKGLRDFTDQLLDAISLFERFKQFIPEYEHVLVDEYQDVNDTQIKLIDLLNPANLFVVGDPRQSIYGWRGSKISHILGFCKENEEGVSVVQLSKNYRSSKRILDVCNKVVSSTGYADLECTKEDDGAVKLSYYASEDVQANAIVNEIKEYAGNKKDIFVLARTNKSLERVKEYLQLHKISYLIRTEEKRNVSVEAKKDQVTLATVHGVKGLEAERVYVINANTNHFPCKASDHPVMDIFDLHDEEYDSFGEELRVLYVALSRAKKELFVSYTSSLSSFFTKETKGLFDKKKKGVVVKKNVDSDDAALSMRLRQWRYNKARERNVPAYIIFNDKTLNSLVSLKPIDLEGLKEVHGLGKAKIDEFGEDLLDALCS